ncbi:unnamed protein product [Protopolystoma xenopodis]|uniref:Uncharacterized protein n=1 Tax=Protopolystoma xenopodis TaxID=117903 RepID=A0A3S5FEI0_9PLAT|nr:unnamed protein product [Protopolystoma xenopodis]
MTINVTSHGIHTSHIQPRDRHTTVLLHPQNNTCPQSIQAIQRCRRLDLFSADVVFPRYRTISVDGGRFPSFGQAVDYRHRDRRYLVESRRRFTVSRLGRIHFVEEPWALSVTGSRIRSRHILHAIDKRHGHKI